MASVKFASGGYLGMYLQEPKLSGILIIDVRALDLWASGLRQAWACQITSAFWLMKVRLSC